MAIRSPRRSEPVTQVALTLIARGTVVTGDLIAEGTLQVEGRIEGTVRSRHRVCVAAGGEIAGPVFAPEIVIAGTVRGDLEGRERVELQAGGTVQGEVTAPRVAVLEGATFNGRLKMEKQGAGQAIHAA